MLKKISSLFSSSALPSQSSGLVAALSPTDVLQSVVAANFDGWLSTWDPNYIKLNGEKTNFEMKNHILEPQLSMETLTAISQDFYKDKRFFLSKCPMYVIGILYHDLDSKDKPHGGYYETHAFDVYECTSRGDASIVAYGVCRSLDVHYNKGSNKGKFQRDVNSYFGGIYSLLNTICESIMETDVYFQEKYVTYVSNDKIQKIDLNADRALYLIFFFTHKHTFTENDILMSIILHPPQNEDKARERLAFLKIELDKLREKIMREGLSTATGILYIIKKIQKTLPVNIQLQNDENLDGTGRLSERENHPHTVNTDQQQRTGPKNRMLDILTQQEFDVLEKIIVLHETTRNSEIHHFLLKFMGKFTKIEGSAGESAENLLQQLQSFDIARVVFLMKLIDTNRKWLAISHAVSRMIQYDSRFGVVVSNEDVNVKLATLMLTALPQQMNKQNAKLYLQSAGVSPLLIGGGSDDEEQQANDEEQQANDEDEQANDEEQQANDEDEQANDEDEQANDEDEQANDGKQHANDVDIIDLDDKSATGENAKGNVLQCDASDGPNPAGNNTTKTTKPPTNNSKPQKPPPKPPTNNSKPPTNNSKPPTNNSNMKTITLSILSLMVLYGMSRSEAWSTVKKQLTTKRPSAKEIRKSQIRHRRSTRKTKKRGAQNAR